MSPTPQHPMSTYEARKATFLQKEAVAGPSRKKGGSGSKVGWPHPIANRGDGSDNGSEQHNIDEHAYPSPRSMANLGLYYSPTADSNDQCTVYPDGHTVSRWKEGQTALARLAEEDPKISWVMIENSRKASEDRAGTERYLWSPEEEDLIPTGKAMVDARLRTFGGAWPLDGKKGWKPTSKKLSSAGFHFSPNEDEEDCVTCIYCQCSLGGWEKADDPVKEHQKRKPECVMFNTTVEKKHEVKETATTTATTRAASVSSGRGRTASRKRAAEMMEADAEEERPSTSRGRGKGKAVESQAEEKKSELTKATQKKRKAATKAKKNLTAAVEEEYDERVEEVSEPKTKKASKKTKTKAAQLHQEENKMEKKVDEPQLEEKDEEMIEASDFEGEPSRSNSRDSEKINDVRMDSPPTSCGSETFKTPKQTTSARPTEKTPKVSSPVKVGKTTSIQTGDIPPLTEIGELTSKERTMTVEEWLKSNIIKACKEMKEEGNRRIAKLEQEMIRGRSEAERILRGDDVHF